MRNIFIPRCILIIVLLKDYIYYQLLLNKFDSSDKFYSGYLDFKYESNIRFFHLF